MSHYYFDLYLPNGYEYAFTAVLLVISNIIHESSKHSNGNKSTGYIVKWKIKKSCRIMYRRD